jgi:redox-regulated HSP33 family molecular chaperone
MAGWRATCAMGLLAALVLAAAACTNEEASTQVAVRNSGDASIDAILGDGDSEMRFEAVAAGTTTSFRTFELDSVSGVTVGVGTQSSTVDLFDGDRNIIDVGPDSRVVRVTRPARSSGSSSGGW